LTDTMISTETRSLEGAASVHDVRLLEYQDLLGVGKDFLILPPVST
jgi:hypothetical protein